MVEEIILVEPSENLIQLLFQSNTTSENETKYLDPNTAISISLVMLVTFTVNILAVVGVFKARITWMFPFLVLYMGFIIESGLALTFNLISKHVFGNKKKFTILVILLASQVEVITYPFICLIIFSIGWFLMKIILVDLVIGETREKLR